MKHKQKNGPIRYRRPGGLIVAGGGFLVLTIFIILNNCNFSLSPLAGKYRFLAHRGLAQTFDIKKVEWDTNTAAIIHKPEHTYIENTIDSMRVAFKDGAEIVELDIRVTQDKKLAVFHDFELGFRTNAKGKISDYSMDELRQLDVGFGYTADGGKTFPLRGTGEGLMPSLDDVLKEFPGKEFLIHIRDDGPQIGVLLLKKLQEMNQVEREALSIYGNDEAIQLIKKEFPKMKALTMKILKRALVEYMLIGWTGIIPKSLKNMEIHLPVEYARFLWGWPGIFLQRIEKVGSRFVLVTKQGAWSGAFDNATDLATVPKGYYGYLWTERIDVVGKGFEENRNKSMSLNCKKSSRCGKLIDVSEKERE